MVRRRIASFTACALLIALAACPASDDGTGGADTDTDTDTDTGGPTADTEGPTADTGATSSETDGEPTGGEPLPAACDMDDPATNAEYSVDVGDWPLEDQNDFRLEDVACSIADVQTGRSVVTTLDCEGPDAAIRPVIVQIPATDAGSPAWQAGDAVVMSHAYLRDTRLRTGVHDWITLHRDSGELLLGAVDGVSSEFVGVPVSDLVPVEIEYDENACGYDDLPDFATPVRHAITFSVGDDALELIGGQRGVLESGDARWAIDLGAAWIGLCCHYEAEYEFVLRAI